MGAVNPPDLPKRCPTGHVEIGWRRIGGGRLVWLCYALIAPRFADKCGWRWSEGEGWVK